MADDLPDSLRRASEFKKSYGMIDAYFTDPEARHIVESFPWRGPANILRLEVLARSNALRRALRGQGAFGHRVLALVDNMGLALAVGKGRKAPFQLRDVTREIAALPLVCRLQAGVRWAPSEGKPADNPSRGLYYIKQQGGLEAVSDDDRRRRAADLDRPLPADPGFPALGAFSPVPDVPWRRSREAGRRGWPPLRRRLRRRGEPDAGHHHA
eukprot:5677729-Pyramimonas_sp.AAC.1